MINAGRSAAIDDIKRHVMTVGSKQWSMVKARHPHVSEASFWRYVRAAKRELATEDDLRVAIERRESRDVAAFDTHGGPGRIDYLAAYRQLYADVGALRDHALNSDGSIRSPMVFDRSIKRRAALLAQSVKLSSQIYAVRNVQAFMDTLIEEVALESPELRRRVLARLRRLHAHSSKESSELAATSRIGITGSACGR